MENSTDQSQKSKSVFLTMVGLLGLNAEVNDKFSGRNIILSVSTDEPGRLIGRNGSALDSIGLLMNRILRKSDNTFPKVIIDVDGYDKKPKHEKRKVTGRKERSQKLEKTVVMNEGTSSREDNINIFVDHETDKPKPVTTVALGGNTSDSSSSRSSKRDNRRSNVRNNRNDGSKRAATSANEPQQPFQSDNQQKPAAKSLNKLQMQCRNAAKEVKRWGEDILLPPLTESDCQSALEYFKKDNEVNVKIDNSKSYGDKKRVRISLKN